MMLARKIRTFAAACRAPGELENVSGLELVSVGPLSDASAGNLPRTFTSPLRPNRICGPPTAYLMGTRGKARRAWS
jgi:hypothetical protein